MLPKTIPCDLHSGTAGQPRKDALNPIMLWQNCQIIWAETHTENVLTVLICKA